MEGNNKIMTDQPFTDEDRARVERLASRFGGRNVVARALAYITHLEGALEAARAEIWIDADGNRFTNVQLAEISGWVPSVVADNLRERITHLEGALESVCNVGDRAAVQVARAALDPATTE